MIQLPRLAGFIGASSAHTQLVGGDVRQAQAERLRSITYEEALKEKVIYGTPEAVTERLYQLQEELGLSRVIYEPNYGCLIPFEQQVTCLRLMTEKVAPHFA